MIDFIVRLSKYVIAFCWMIGAILYIMLLGSGLPDVGKAIATAIFISVTVAFGASLVIYSIDAKMREMLFIMRDHHRALFNANNMQHRNIGGVPDLTDADRALVDEMVRRSR